MPPVIFTREDEACVQWEDEEGQQTGILYSFIEGEETDPEQDAEQAGALIGSLHRMMEVYPGPLVEREKPYYIRRYIDILRKKEYPRAEEFAFYGEALWKKVKKLPRGYCHGDMYCGNTHRAVRDGGIYLLDFDTSGRGFPMYDIVLYCNKTHYFRFQEDGLTRSQAVLRRFLPEYRRYHPVGEEEIQAFPDLMALYHFALQATVMENNGLNCVDNAFLDRQLDWLYRWREQCRFNFRWD